MHAYTRPQKLIIAESKHVETAEAPSQNGDL